MLALKVHLDIGSHVLHRIARLLRFLELDTLPHQLVGCRLFKIGHLLVIRRVGEG